MIANVNSVETDLLVQLQSGNEVAFEEFVTLYTQPMLRLAKSFLNNEEDAEDAVQDAFLAAFKSLPRFSGDCALKTWMHRIVVNACLMKLRSRKCRPCFSIEGLLPQFDETGHHVQAVSTLDANPIATMISRETRDKVRACIDELPEDYRSVLILRDIEEIDTAQAADILDTTHGAIKTRLHRARQALRTLLCPFATISEIALIHSDNMD